ncbi:MAG: bacillithiol biosynthesis cysteine-adding enzyme BshC [Deltaproteobacteria bacterium]|nr:bacillithiol biosynthesis cysteine-adding enzyme BshC [Deltaproteobacteria bacterium]
MKVLDPLNDFLNGAPSTRNFFERSFLLEEDVQKQIELVKTRKLHSEVVNALREQNDGVSSLVDSQLEKLDDPNVVFVVTGQQLGLLGGPLFTLYKILTAIKYASDLEKSYRVPVIPIFWLQSEDHDFDEIAEAHIYDADLKTSKIKLTMDQSKLGGPVGELLLSTSDVQDLKEQIDDPKFNLIVDKYAESKKLSLVFSEIIREFCSELGLVCFDFHAADLKPQLLGLILDAFSKSSEIASVLKTRENELSQLGIKPQVHVREDSPLLFVTENNQRMRVQNNSYSTEQIEKLIREEPKRISTSALIRPLVQDSLFKTVAYIAGPGEFQYWLQLKPLYQFFKLPQPLVVPRAKMFISEQAQTKLLRKLSIDVEDLRKDKLELVKELVEFNLEKDFQELEGHLKDSFSKIEPHLLELDQNLKSPLAKTLNSSLQNLEKLKRKAERSFVNRNAILTEQVDRLVQYFYPDNVPQERVIAAASFFTAYGSEFVSKIYNEIDLKQLGKYQVVELDGVVG